ncbi:MAG: single-stranded-DNA-specific exonuclease RecJ, partial [bacterium]
GLDLLITDHHIPGPRLPDALALVNPRLSPAYPYGQLVGVAVAYKLAEALLRALDHPRRVDFLDHMLELVALGTVCDVAPLDGENRSFTRLGLERLRQGRWLGLRSLAKAGGVDWREADAGTLGFQFGPRLNAGGRVGDAMLGLRLLLGKDADEAARLAVRLDDLNRERRELEKSAVDEASRRAEVFLSENPGARALTLWDAGWHAGVVGLVAARLLERFLLPVFVFSVDGETAKGSGRARSPLRLADCLQGCAAHLLKFGGHEAAAGATARTRDLPAFAQAFEAQAAQSPMGEGRVVDVDLEVTLQDVDEGWMGPLSFLEPHGRHNPRPVFLTRGVRLGADSRPVGADGSHLKLSLSHGSRSLPGIAFGQGAHLGTLRAAPALDAVVHLSWNVWRGRRTLQLDVKDIRPSITS